MILCLDTETSGVPAWKLPSEDPGQPFLCEIAMIGLDETTLEEIDVYSAIVRPPEGRTIPPEIAEIHGISTAKAIAEGVAAGEIAKTYSRKRKACSALLAHNTAFDVRIMRIEMLRAGAPKEHCDTVEEASPQLCTQKIMTPVVKMPPTEAMKKYPGLAKRFKSASLEDCVLFCFGGSDPGAHGALTDARSCGRVYRWARDNGHLK